MRELELTVLRRVDGVVQGDFPGRVPGPGFERGEGREYTPGDDVRRIDWKLTARAGVPFVRDTVADRELELWVVLDRSASLAFSTARSTKWELALGGLACLSFLTARSGGRVGVVVFGAGVLDVRPARPGLRNARSLLFDLSSKDPARVDGNPSTLADALRVVNRVARRRGPVAVFSDFLGDVDWVGPLRSVGARHDVLAFEVVDPHELDLPPLGTVVFEDPETGRTVEMRTSGPGFRDRYAALVGAHRDEVAAALRAAGADHTVLRTDHDWVRDVTGFLVRRRRVARAAARVGTAVRV
jgi:uncharacterized protein (DUF58 family)